MGTCRGGIERRHLFAADRQADLLALRDETAVFKPEPNPEATQNNCTTCHAADCIQTQPRDVKSKKDFWQAEVTKMIKLYGAPTEDAEAAKIVD